MKKIIFVIMVAVSLAACAETWEGVKKDIKTITRSVGDAGNQLGEKIGDALSGDKDKEGEE